MKYTTVKISEIRKHPTLRLDAGYWIKKKKKAASRKLQEGIDYEVDNIDDYIKRVKSHKPQASSCKRLETDTIKK